MTDSQTQIARLDQRVQSLEADIADHKQQFRALREDTSAIRMQLQQAGGFVKAILWMGGVLGTLWAMMLGGLKLIGASKASETTLGN